MPAIDHPKEELLRLHYNMLLTRQFEDRLSKLYRQGKILGGLYLSTGQEAIPAGILLSAVLMLNHIGETQAARRLEGAVADVLREGKHVTADLIEKGSA